MTRNVIVEDKDGKQLGVYPIGLGGLNYAPADREFFDAAIDCAISDGAAKEADRKTLTYKFA